MGALLGLVGGGIAKAVGKSFGSVGDCISLGGELGDWAAGADFWQPGVPESDPDFSWPDEVCEEGASSFVDL